MCPAINPRRLSDVTGEYLATVNLVFWMNTTQSAPDLLRILGGSSGQFIQGAGLPETSHLSLVSFTYTEGVSSGGQSGSGEVIALVDLVIGSAGSPKLSRRLAGQDIGSAVSSAFQQVVSLPSGSAVTCLMTGNTANVSISVPNDLQKTQTAVADFLLADSAAEGPHRLPHLISANAGGISIDYAPGYIPIVWTSNGSPLASTLNVLPYILAGVGVVIAVIVVLVIKYRFVIRSWIKDIGARRSWRGTGGWTMGRYAAYFVERSKSDLSSTPDTATNVDDDDVFEDLFLSESVDQGVRES
jgi:hypothetical protein